MLLEEEQLEFIKAYSRLRLKMPKEDLIKYLFSSEIEHSSFSMEDRYKALDAYEIWCHALNYADTVYGREELNK